MRLCTRYLLKLPLVVLAFSWAAMAQADVVTVFAAASLKTVLDDLQPDYQKHSGHELRLVYAGSSILARQIGQGAPADVFISANVAWMDVLEKQGFLASTSRVDLIGNRLVVISPQAGEPIEMREFATLEGRVAMGLVEAVPAGIYGKQALEFHGLWEALKPRVVQTDNVRAALALVARGEVALGIVYASDAEAEPRVYLRAEFEAASHAPIIYPAALTSKAGSGGAQYLAFLQSDAAQKRFEQHGFLRLGARP